MKLYLPLFILFIGISSCQVTASTKDDYNDAISKFLASKQLDKRTTLLRIQDDEKLNGLVESKELKTEFFNYLKEEGFKTMPDLTVVDNPKEAIVGNSVANVRSQPKHSGELATQYLMGQPVKVLDSESNWFLVQGPDHYLGWVDSGGILTDDEISKEWQAAPKVTVQANETSAYANAQKNTVISDLVFGNILGDLGNGNYILPNGKQVVLASADVLTPPTETDKIDLVLDKAYSLLGRPYLWGGTSTKGMDCSGFTRTSFMNAGYLLGRDASLQVSEGEEVDKDDMASWQRGDLLFFGNYREDGSMRITHVAIHVKDGAFIHSAGSVNEQSLNPDHEKYSKERAETLMAVRRIF